MPAKADPTSDPVELRLATSAAAKIERGQTPTAREQRALQRITTAREEEDRLRYYRTVPKRHYVEMAGTSIKVLHDHADKYGLPLRGGTLNLYEVIRGLHGFIKKHSRKLAQVDDDDPLLSGVASPWLERYREERTLLARYERLRLEGELLRREDVHQFLARWADRLRQCGEQLQRHHGADALATLNEALDDLQRLMDTQFNAGE